MTAWARPPRRPEPVVVLRSELGATTCHVRLDQDLGDLLRGGGDGVKIRVFVCRRGEGSDESDEVVQ